jgi:predicted NAD/FAD-binding protein
MAGALLQIALLTAGLVAAFGLLGLLTGLFCGTVRLRPRRRRAEEPVHRPVQQVAADLRRLAGQLAFVPAGVPVARRRGLQAAYDDVLVEAAALLEVPHAMRLTPAGRARDLERARLQAALTGAGLDPR